MKNRRIKISAVIIAALFAFLLSQAFSGVVYVKKEGDAGPPAEGVKASAADYQVNEKNGYGSPDAPPAKGKKLSPQEEYKKAYVYSGEKSTNMVALTFDDGPSQKFTNMILATLKEKNVKATFFLLGNKVKPFPDLAKKMVEEGHEVASHTFSHPNLKTASRETIEKELADTNDIIEKTTGQKPRLLRPPFGNSSKTVVEVCEKLGIGHVVIWSLDTEDWKPKTSTEDIISKISSQTTGGSIILMHETNPKTPEAIRTAIDTLLSKGFKLVTVSELIEASANAKPAASNAPAPVIDKKNAPGAPVPVIDKKNSAVDPAPAPVRKTPAVQTPSSTDKEEIKENSSAVGTEEKSATEKTESPKREKTKPAKSSAKPTFSKMADVGNDPAPVVLDK